MAIGDADNDGRNELLYGSTCKVTAPEAPNDEEVDRLCMVNKHHLSRHGDWSVPWAVADPDGDARKEIIASVDSGGNIVEPWLFEYSGTWTISHYLASDLWTVAPTWSSATPTRWPRGDVPPQGCADGG